MSQKHKKARQKWGKGDISFIAHTEWHTSQHHDYAL
jgi:hypothetical protein